MKAVIPEGEVTRRKAKWSQCCSYCGLDLNPGDWACKHELTKGWVHEACLTDRWIDHQLTMDAVAQSGQPILGKRIAPRVQTPAGTEAD
jgi:hypothetical protein